jgi:hypothetical protein
MIMLPYRFECGGKVDRGTFCFTQSDEAMVPISRGLICSTFRLDT